MKLRWREILLSVFIAVSLWYGVTGSEKVESQIEVRVDYKGMPPGLVVRDGLVNRLSVRVRASEGRLRSMLARDYTFSMDLSSVVRGENILPVTADQMPFWGNVEVMDITPSRIVLNVDRVTTKRVPLEASLQGDLPEGYTAEVSFTPEAAELRGPSTLLELLNSVRVPVHLGDEVSLGNHALKRPLALPDGIDVTPAEVDVLLHVDLVRKDVTVQRNVETPDPDGVGVFVRPDRVRISLAAPEAEAAGAAKNTAIRAYVVLPNMELGSHIVPVLVSFPEGYLLQSIDPEEITVTLEQRDQEAAP